jgi:endonuclease YncB( thermonuclease family)
VNVRAPALVFACGLWLGLLAGGVQAAEWVSGRVVSVTDGDTAVIETTRQKILRVRFYGVDAPEAANEHWPAQPYAAAATTFMRDLCGGKPVRVRLSGERTYKREVGEVFIGERSASQALVGAGLAWWNRKFAPDDRELDRLESKARRRGIGLWQDRRPVPPWRHRGRYRSHARH